MDYIFQKNDNTRQELLDHFNDQILNERYNVGCSMTFNHITVKFRQKRTDLYIAQNLIKDFMHWLNEDYSNELVGKEKRHYKDIEQGFSFAVTGIAEIKNGNFHVHLLMRIPSKAVIDSTYEKKLKQHWRQLTGSGTLEFSRYDAEKETVINQQTISTKTGAAELRDDIKLINEGWANYMTKTVKQIDGKFSEGWEFIGAENGY